MKMFNPLIVITCLLLFCSCNSERYIYSAPVPNNPFFTTKGESKLAGYYSTGTVTTTIPKKINYGGDLQGAYAITNHWALTAGYSTRQELNIYNYNSNISPFDSSMISYQRHFFEYGGGYFIALNEKKTITANLYGGAGSGKFSFQDIGQDHNGINYSRYHNSSVTKWFFQPSINILALDYFRFGIILKSSYVHYNNIKTSYTVAELQYFSLDKIAGKTFNFIEPSFSVEFIAPQYPWIKLDLLMTGVQAKPLGRLAVRSHNFTIGLSADFSKLKKAKK